MRPLILALLFTVAVGAQPYLNLDFETATRNRARAWSLAGAGYELVLDTSTVQSGSQSLRIRFQFSVPNSLGVASQLLPLDLARGRRVRFNGWIKHENVTRNNAGLWFRVDGPIGTITIDNAPPPNAGPPGTRDWTRYTIDRQVDPNATQIVFGAFQSGDGTAWFDNFDIELEGVPLTQPPVPVIGEPTAEQLDWIRPNAIPVDTPDAGNSFAELQALKRLIGNARLVGLGEATHGTSEFFRMKHRLVEFLATEMGFTIFSIEANLPEAYRVNDFILTGRGDPRELLRGMYFWTWNTQEVLDMILWMREFNRSGRGLIQFTGFDMQTGTVAAAIVRAFVAGADPGYLLQLDAAYALVREAANLRPANAQDLARFRPQYEAATAAARQVWQYLESNRAKYVAKLPARGRSLGVSLRGRDIDWAIENGKIVEQATFVSLGGTFYRDQAMAGHVEWILSQAPPGAKMVLWAHNGHVAKEPRWMGSYLAQRFGADYVVLGFAFHEGRYNAVGNRGLTSYDASPSFPGSLEYIFHSTGMPRLILDLRRASRSVPGSTFLLDPIEFRSIGAVVADGFFLTQTLTRDYDALIFFDQTTPSALLTMGP